MDGFRFDENYRIEFLRNRERIKKNKPEFTLQNHGVFGVDLPLQMNRTSYALWSDASGRVTWLC